MSQVKLPYMMGIKMRMYPSRRQQAILWKNINASRFVYNQLLANSYEDAAIFRNKLDEKYPIPEEYWQYNKKGQVIKKSQVRPTGLARITKQRYPWLGDKDIDSDMPNNTLIHYNFAWNNFRKVHSTGKPKFKRKDKPVQSYSTSCHYSSKTVAKHGGVPSLYNGSIKFGGECHNFVTLPKIGKVRVKRSRELPKNPMIRISTVTIKHDAADNWYVALLVKSDTPFNELLPPTNSEIGYDLNTDNFLTDSKGNVIANPRYYRTIKSRLAKEQRILSRRQRRAKKMGKNLRNAKNYQKQRMVVARLHAKVRNQRNNFLHQLSTALIKNHDLVVGENLQSKNMLKNYALAMSISDTGWRTFIGMLEYKAPKYGRIFVKVNPKYTTQKCSHCGFRMGTNGTEKLTLKDRQWICPNCGTHHIRDWNAAKNILEKGYQQLAQPITADSLVYK